jgi:phospholipid/cholesterol/gamma-HCH transport system substrate-binding protein
VNRKGLLAPIIAILLVIPVTLLVKDLGFEQPNGTYEVKAELADASGLVRNSNVKIGGVDAGLITELELTEDDTALLTMVLDPESGEIGAGATAAARPVNLLGEKYVDLEVGDLKDPQPSGTMIPMERTSTPVEIDDALNILEPGVRARLRILINEAGIMLAGRGADFNGLLEELPPAIDELAGLVQEARSETERMGLLIDQGDRVLASIAGERDNLGKLVDSAANALEVTASRREELGQTFSEAPRTLTELTHTFDELGITAGRLEPTARHLAQTADPLHDTFEQLPEFANAAEGALKTASDVAPDLERLGREGHPIVAELKPTLERTNSFLGTADPILKKLAGNNEPGEGSFAGLMGLMHNWALAIPTSDGLSHLFGIKAYVSNNTIRHAVERMTSPDDVELSSKKDGKKPASDKPKPSSDENVNAYAGPDEAAGEGALGQADEKVKEVVDKVGQTVKDTVDKVNDVKDKLLENVKDKLGSALGNLKQNLDKLGVSKLRELLETPRSKVQSLVDQLSRRGDQQGEGAGRGSALRLLDFLFAP